MFQEHVLEAHACFYSYLNKTVRPGILGSVPDKAPILLVETYS